MAFPSVVSTATSNRAADGINFSITMPGSIVVGNLLLVCVQANVNIAGGEGGVTGWTKYVETASNVGAGGSLFILGKVATASNSCSFGVTNAIRSAVAFQIQDWWGADLNEIYTAVTAATLDVPNLAPAPGAQDWLWLAVARNGVDLTAAPTNYSNYLESVGTSGTHQVATGRRTLNASSENPSTFSGTQNGGVAALVAIRPAEPFGDIVYLKNGDAGAAYGTTGPSIPYPTGMVSGDLMVLISGQKPATAGGGVVTDPSGWSLAGSLLNAGGYGATLGADTGDMNLRVWTKTATGSESGTFTLTASDSSVVFGHICAFHSTVRDTWDVDVVTGSDTSAGNVSVTFDSDPGVIAEDYILAPFVIPTDVTTPSQFSAEALSQTGVTFDTVYEVVEYDSATGNDMGGFLARARVLSGTGSAAPVLTATAGGTTTNVRGPAAFIRIRRSTTPAASPSKFLPFFG